MPMPENKKLNDGTSIPLLGLGTWKSQSGQVSSAVDCAITKGYQLIDCAMVYGNETEVGQGIAQGLKATNRKREDIYVVSKLWNTLHQPGHVEAACKKSLSNLGLAYLDLYLIHWPHAFKYEGEDILFPKNEDGSMRFDVDTHFMDTWLAMEKLVEMGLVKSIGLSNFNSKQINEVLEKGNIKPAVLQIECHPYLNQSKMKNFCDEKGIAMMAYSPFGSPDRPWAKPDDPSLLEDPRLGQISAKLKKTPAQVVLRWLIQRGIIVIPKSVTLTRIEENFNVFDFQLTDSDMKEMESFECNGRVVVPLKPNGEHRDAGHPLYPFQPDIEF